MVIVGGAVLAMPPWRDARSSGGPARKVGVLFPGTLGAERERLINEGLANELGNQKAELVARSSAGDEQLLGKYASELANTVDLILAIASGSLLAARRASRTIPIVALDLEADPIAIGAAQSLNRPGGNVTGIFLDAPEIAGKWLQIIREMIPKTRTSHCSTILHLDQTQLRSAESSARSIGLETLKLAIDQPGEFRAAFQRGSRRQGRRDAGALLTCFRRSGRSHRRTRTRISHAHHWTVSGLCQSRRAIFVRTE